MGGQTSRKERAGAESYSTQRTAKNRTCRQKNREERQQRQGKAGLLQVGKGMGSRRGGKRREQGRGGESTGAGGGGERQRVYCKWAGGGAGGGGNTKKQQKVRGSRRHRPTSQAETVENGHKKRVSPTPQDACGLGGLYFNHQIEPAEYNYQPFSPFKLNRTQLHPMPPNAHRDEEEGIFVLPARKHSASSPLVRGHGGP